MICYSCRQDKPESDFSADKTSPRGYRADCRVCRSARRRANEALKRENRPIRKRGRACQQIVVLSDVHIPEHDRAFWRVTLEFIRKTNPDEVILSGDFGEYASVSQHGGGFESRLTDDLTAVKQALDELRNAAGPDARITYLEGNHESRLPRAVASWAPTLTGAVDLPSMLELEKRGIIWVPEHQQPVHRGALRVLHGHQLLGKYGPKHHAAKAADIYGSTAGVEIIYGHVHQSQVYTKAVAGGYVSSTSIPCGRTIGPDNVRWLQGREAGWHHGFCVAYVTEAIAQVYPVKVRKGQFFWAGKLYGSAEASNVAPTFK